MGLVVQECIPVPGPPGIPVLGNIFDIDSGSSSTSFFNLARKYGGIFQLRGPGIVILSVNSAALVTEVCGEDRFRKLVEGGLIELRHAVNNGLLTAETSDPAWKAAHHIAMPYLTPVKIRELFGDMKDIVSQMCLKWARHGQSHAFDVNKDFTRMALDVVGLCGFRYRFNSFYDSTESNPFAVRLDRFLKEADARQWRLPFMSSLHVFKKKQFMEDINYMRRICFDVIAKRRADASEHNDILSALMKGQDPESGKGLDDDSLADNLLTILAAGHETTSGTLSFALYYLIQNPDALIKAQQEVDRVFENGTLAVEHLSKLPYIDAVLRETLRFHSTVPLISRTCDEDQILAGKYYIKKETPIILNIYASHRDPEVYGPDVDQWKPERMFGDKFKQLPLGAWRAFGTGVRACIGRAFAWQEMQIALAMLLYTFNFEAVDSNYKLRYKDRITLNPLGFTIRTHLRDANRYEALVKGHQQTSEAVNSVPNGINSKLNGTAGKPMRVLYGSDNGMAQSLAHLFATHAAQRGYSAKVDNLNTAKENLPTDQPVIIFTSSYNGEPPLTAAHFVSWLQSLNGSALENVTYAVFGCGHRDWSQTFQRIPKLVDDLLKKRGGARLTPLYCADAAIGDTLSDFQDWEEQQLWSALASDDNDRISMGTDRTMEQVTIPSLMLPQQDLSSAYITEICTLTQTQAPKKMHLELNLPAGSTYNAGDYIVVAPVNPSHLVQRVLSRFELAWDSDLRFQGHGMIVNRNEKIVANEFLSNNVELAHAASGRNMRYLASLAQSEHSEKALATYAEQNGTHEWTVLDLLEEYPDVKISIQQYLSLLPPLRARTYSISSSPLHNPEQATITFSIVTKVNKSNTKHPKIGITSGYLSCLTPGSLIRQTIRSPRTNFMLPANLESTPMIMIAAGSGIAPFRGFVQERHILIQGGRKLAQAVLFFGCRTAKVDDIYRDEFDTWQSNGAVTVHRAFSKPAKGQKQYVQDVLGDHGDELRELWAQGARCYVCGAPKMADEVRKGFEAIVGQLTDADLAGDRFLTEIFS